MKARIGKLSIASTAALVLLAGMLSPVSPANAVEEDSSAVSPEVQQVVEDETSASVADDASEDETPESANVLSDTVAPLPAPSITATAGEFGGFILNPTSSHDPSVDGEIAFWSYVITDTTNGVWHNMGWNPVEVQFYHYAKPGRTFEITGTYTTENGVKSEVGSLAFTMPGEIGPDPLVPIGTAVISGTFKVGSTLTARPTGWGAGKYEWLRNGKVIAGTTWNTYKLKSADAGKKISVRITAPAFPGYREATVTSASKLVPLQKLVASTPKISKKSSSAKVGKTLKVSVGKWTSGTKHTYQWLRNGKAIKGATKASYKITKSDKSKKISVKVTGKKSGYATASKTSNKTAKIK